MAKPSLIELDQESSAVAAKLEVLRKQEAHYEELLQHIQNLKTTVFDERKALEARAQELSASKVPVNWLPNELLGQIFLYATAQQGLQESRAALPSTPSHTPIIVSQVCRRWRETALSTPHIWSFLYFRGRWNSERARVFVSRSHLVPLDLCFQSDLDTSATQECRRVTMLLNIITAHLDRVKRLDIGVKAPEAVVPVVMLLQDPLHTFSRLESLSLSIITFNPLFSSSGGSHRLLENNLPTDQLYTVPKTTIPVWSHLTHLKLEEIPLFNLPYHFLANLTSLELTFPPRKITPNRKRYYLRVSAVLHLLSLAPSLEELNLTNTVPIFDVILPDDNQTGAASNLPLIPTPPISLTRLKAINWHFPYAGDVHRFMSFILCPQLESLDLWIEGQSTFRDQPPWRGHEAQSFGLSPSAPCAIVCPSVRDVCLQCPDDEVAISSLRKFAFPTLEKFELINVDKHPSFDTEAAGAVRSLPTLPRLDTLFRDPRLFHLTHLTLSHFQFTQEHRRADAVLGYMPVLTSLSLDTCSGVGNLIQVLDGMVLSPFSLHQLPNGNSRARRGVKVCPRLETLSFWDCDDLRFSTLRAIVLARNSDDNGNGLGESREEGEGEGAAVVLVASAAGNPDGAGRVDVTGPARNGNWAGKAEQKVLLQAVGRKIKPLRRPLRQVPANGPECGLPGGPATPRRAEIAPSTNIISTIVAAQEAFQPAAVTYIRVHKCRRITKTDAFSLKCLGVSDIVWTGPE